MMKINKVPVRNELKGKSGRPTDHLVEWCAGCVEECSTFF